MADILYGSPPYGWKLSKDRARLVKDPAEQRVIATILRMHADGMSIRAIVDDLQARGVRNRLGAPFSRTSVHHVVRRGTKPPPEAW
jgi:hypothetical protein